MDIFFFLSLVILCDTFVRSYQRYSLPKESIFIAVPYVVYLAMLVPGISGHFTVPNVVASLALLTILINKIGLASSRIQANERPADSAVQQVRLTFPGLLAIMPLAVIALVFAFTPESTWLSVAPGTIPSSLLEIIQNWIARTLGFQNYTLDWDVASYHLPGLMEFLQNHTLWSFEGPYQSYSYGFELITGISVLGGGILSVLVGNMLGPVIAIVAARVAVRSIGANTTSRRLGLPYDITLMMLIIGMIVFVAGSSIEQVGKNDIFVASCILASLSFMLQSATLADGVEHQRNAQSLGILSSAAAMALAISAKPNALAYLPLWVASMAFIMWKFSNSSYRNPYISAAAGLILISGLAFSLRNIVAFGKISGDLSFNAWNQTVFTGLSRNIFWGMLKPIDIQAMVYLGISVASLFALTFITKGFRRIAVSIFGIWVLYGLVVFAITPFSLFLERGIVQWRMAALSLLAGGVGLIALIDHLFSGMATLLERKVTLTKTVARPVGQGSVRYWFGGALASVAAIVCVHHLNGSPRPQQIIPRAHAGIYDWVAAQPGPLRIYAAGFRPYGLFGPDLRHHLFYDLNSISLYNQNYAEKRLNTVRRDFSPNLIIIGVDKINPIPHSGKPAAEWLSRQPCITEVYATFEFSAFAVESGCSTPWGDGSTEPGRLRMGA